MEGMWKRDVWWLGSLNGEFGLKRGVLLFYVLIIAENMIKSKPV